MPRGFAKLHAAALEAAAMELANASPREDGFSNRFVCRPDVEFGIENWHLASLRHYASHWMTYDLASAQG